MTNTKGSDPAFPASLDDFDFGDDFSDECPNCGGEGVIYMCFEEYACIDPEGGCDLCERRCDWCRPAAAREQK